MFVRKRENQLPKSQSNILYDIIFCYLLIILGRDEFFKVGGG